VKSRFLVLLLALVALAGPAVARGDDTITLAPDANTAWAYNTTDNSSLFEFAFAIRHVMSDVVDQQNVAVAWSKCNSCQTTAIAIEIVLVSGSPSTVSPQNVAVAVNESCTLCDTFASAYQFVIGVDGPVRLTGRGIAELRHIRKEIASWADLHLTNEQIKVRLDDAIARIKQVLATELRSRNRDEGDQGDENTSTRQHDAQPNAPPGNSATTDTGTVQTTTTVPTETDTTTTTPTTTDTGTTTTTTTVPTAPTTTTTP
jgi:putative peptide zinc metalloprotease protein